MFAWKNYTNLISFSALSWYILIFHQNCLYSSSAATFIYCTVDYLLLGDIYMYMYRQHALKDLNYSWCCSSLFILRVKITLMLNIQDKDYVTSLSQNLTSATKLLTEICSVFAKKSKILPISITFWHSYKMRTIKWPVAKKSCYLPVPFRGCMNRPLCSVHVQCCNGLFPMAVHTHVWYTR